MKGCIVQLLGVLIMVATAGTAWGKEVPFHESTLGEVKARVISLVEKDLDAAILRADTDEQKAAVARFYPDGKVRNRLNVLLLRRGETVALVDTGFDWTAGELDAALGAVGLGPEDVTHVIITHAHGDHTGGLIRDGRPAFPRATVLFPEKELAYWSDPGHEGVSSRTFGSVAAIRRLYGERVHVFAPGEDICASRPGVKAVDEAGHMPGHVGILIAAGGRTLFFWSDLLHAFDAQTADPSLSTSFDMDPEQAARVRAELLARARAEGWSVVGSHVPFTQPCVLK